MDLKEIGCEGVDRIELAQIRVHLRVVVNTVPNPGVQQNEGKFLD
jgi:hypothetical protein